jgi:hypothetical protein
MKFERIKRYGFGLVMALGFVIAPSLSSFSDVQAQSWRYGRWEDRQDRLEDRYERQRAREWERRELARIRQLDRQRMLRYQYLNGSRVVGFYDRFGRFHAVGFYDRWGNFRRY